MYCISNDLPQEFCFISICLWSVFCLISCRLMFIFCFISHEWMKKMIYCGLPTTLRQYVSHVVARTCLNLDTVKGFLPDEKIQYTNKKTTVVKSKPFGSVAVSKDYFWGSKNIKVEPQTLVIGRIQHFQAWIPCGGVNDGPIIPHGPRSVPVLGTTLIILRALLRLALSL